MPSDEGPETLLQGVIRAFGLRPTHIARVAQRIARTQGKPSISRSHLIRIANGQYSPTKDRIFIIVAAINELTGRTFRGGDLFELDAAAASAGAAAAVGYSAGPSSSDRNPAPELWRTYVPEESGQSAEKTFEQLYNEYSVLLRRIAIRRYDIPPDDAEALVHETFLGYLERHAYVREVKPYLYATLRHRCVDYWRARRKEAPLLPEHEETADQRQNVRLDALERNLAVAAVLSRLGESCRETLHGVFFKGEHQDALADRLNTSPGTIDQLISTCRRRAAHLYRSLTARRT